MIDTNRATFALLAGAVLAVTAGSVAFGAVDLPPAPPSPPAPPEPPAPPSPPTPPSPPKINRQIVIVENHGDEDGKGFVRTITRDGRTYVFQTDRALDDSEVEQRIASAEARIPSVPPVAGHDRRMMKQRVVVMNDKGEEITDVVTEEGDAPCKGKQVVSDVDTSAEDGGKLTRVRVRMCGTPGDFEKHAMAEAIKGIREARAEIAGDRSLSEQVRGQILRDLDAEIARIGHEG